MPPEVAVSAVANVRAPDTRPPALQCRNLTVGYDDVAVLRGLDLAVSAGETLALLGPSGTGKTTLLHTIAGFLRPTDGELLLDGRVVASARRCLPPEKRNAAMVFQHYALWPHLDALDNVAFPLRRSGLGKRAARAAALELLDRLGLAALAHRRPAQLSGGQQQRVGLARALARRATVTLLDEPTAHLDPALRAQVQAEFARAVRTAGGAVVYATHDAAEALAVADRVALLRDGRVLQVGTPVELYEQPVDLWAARLTGPATLLTGHPTESGIPAPSGDGGRERRLLVRPEWTALGGPLRGRIRDLHYRGGYTDYLLDTPAGAVLVRADGPPRVSVGSDTTWSLRRAWFLPPESSDA
jgi:ABC-type Fe3+/spermidine/putrescine transport system ATPase subunit